MNILKRGLLPSQATFVAATESCIGLRNLLCGECVHAKVINSKFEKLVSTHYCFDMIEEKNVFSWNALMLGYSNVCSSTSTLLL